MGYLGTSKRWLASIALAAIAGCNGVVATAPQHAPLPATAPSSVVDLSAASCAVTYDGFIWYQVPIGVFSPIDVRRTRCGSFALGRDFSPPRPRWAIPDGPTNARFVATSLQQKFSIAGMLSLERTAARHHVPVTWLMGDLWWTSLAPFYDVYHATNGDDVETEPFASLHAAAKAVLPWYVPTVSVQGAGGERNLRLARALGERSFWGITWNSNGVDGTRDRGAPWGTYCADVRSYKRPAPDGRCGTLAFEWTARDLTRAYLSEREDDFSTDPDDLQRAGMKASDAARYVRELIDAYAAAGQTQPLVTVSQQESGEEFNRGDPEIMNAIYGQAVADGMHVETLRQAAADARRFSAAPRAVAFPFLRGGVAIPSPILHGDSLYPATIDYHDVQTGMTFLAGHTLPTRLFRYADNPVSRFNVPLTRLPPSNMPALTGASISHGQLVLAFRSPQALHYGIAIWSDPALLGIVRPGAVPAGRAGIVVTFDLHRGRNVIAIACPGCLSLAFPYST
jgi:hypothetical protein